MNANEMKTYKGLHNHTLLYCIHCFIAHITFELIFKLSLLFSYHTKAKVILKLQMNTSEYIWNFY
jgi:hypothetical protein